MPEQENTEFKQSWHDDYLKWVCGFANAVGGTIYIGRDDAGNAVHLADYARLMEDIPNKIRNSMGIVCDVNLRDEAANKYIEIKVIPIRCRYHYVAAIITVRGVLNSNLRARNLTSSF